MSDSAPSYTRHVRGLAAFVVGYALVDLLPVLLPKTPVFMGLRVSDLADAGLIFVLAALYVQLGLLANDDGAWGLIYFLDERWGHIELHLAFLLIAATFIGCSDPTRADQARRPLSASEEAAILVLALTYGILLAGDAVEGQTVALMLPAALLLSLWGFSPYLRGIKNQTQPVVSFYRRFFAASLTVTVVALVLYGVIAGGFPELSELGAVAAR
jgi:hypothetical protein